MLTGSLEGHFNWSHHQLIDNVLLHEKDAIGIILKRNAHFYACPPYSRQFFHLETQDAFGHFEE